MFNLPYGFFIAIEGSDGAGKTTVIPKLAEYLKPFVKELVVTREPGGTPFAEKIRNILKDDVSKDVSHTALAMLVNAARRDHVENVIMPALSRGGVIITDRYVCSTFMYQSDAVELATLCELGTIAVIPDLVILLDISYDTYVKRIMPRVENGELSKEELNHLDIMSEAVFNKRRQGMLAFKDKYSSHCVLLDSNLLDEETLNETCQSIIFVAMQNKSQ